MSLLEPYIKAINNNNVQSQFFFLNVGYDKGLLFVYPRKEKIFKKFKNWRPIILLNTVYKIASSCIAARLKTVLPKLIGDDQKFFLERQIYMGKY